VHGKVKTSLFKFSPIKPFYISLRARRYLTICLVLATINEIAIWEKQKILKEQKSLKKPKEKESLNH
jgi:hypothetical protein